MCVCEIRASLPYSDSCFMGHQMAPAHAVGSRLNFLLCAVYSAEPNSSTARLATALSSSLSSSSSSSSIALTTVAVAAAEPAASQKEPCATGSPCTPAELLPNVEHDNFFFDATLMDEDSEELPQLGQNDTTTC